MWGKNRLFKGKTVLFLFVLFVVWIAADQNEVGASESDYEFKDVIDGVEITNYVGVDDEVTIPTTLDGKNVIGIGANAFYNKGLTSVVLPDTLERIGDRAFGINQLTEVTIGGKVTSIGLYLFIHNPIAKISVDLDNPEYSNNGKQGLYTKDGKRLVLGTRSGEIADGTEVIGRYAFTGLGVQNITIPASVTTIEQSAFSNNELTSVVIPSNVTNMESYVFSENWLTSVNIQANITTIADRIFAYNSLTSITIPESVTSIGLSAFRENQLSSITFPDALMEIKNFAFMGNQLTSIELGKNITVIGGHVFADNLLEQIEVDLQNPNYMAIEGKVLYTKDGKMLIQGTRSGKIADGTEVIGSGAFWGAELGDIVIPSSVTSIGSSAFRDSQLTSVKIPETVTSILSGAFQSNPDLFIVSEVGSAAESYANNNNIRFLTSSNPLLVELDPNDSAGQWVGEANTKVTVYGFGELEFNYIWSTDSESRPTDSDEWIPSVNGVELSHKEHGEWFLHIYAEDDKGNSTYTRSDLFKVDKQSPTVTFQPNGNNRAGEIASTTVTVVDVESGLDESSLEYVWSTSEEAPTDEAWASFTNDRDLTHSMDADIWYLHVRATDIIGNTVESRSNAFKKGRSGGGGGGYTPSPDATVKNFEMIFGDNSLIEFDPNQFEYTLETEADEVELIIEPSHGSAHVKVNDEIAEGKITVPLKEGENRIEIIVIAENGDEQTYTITIHRLKGVPFTDISNHWAEEYIREAYRNGWFKGYPNGDFGPDNPVTRMQTASLFVRILGLTDGSAVPFTDIQSVEKETIEELEKAYANGVVNGFIDQTFQPYREVTRAQLALMIYRSFEKITGTPYEPNQLANFSDIVQYDEETQNAIAMLVELGIAEGSEGKFSPNDRATRAHAAKMLVNYKEVFTSIVETK